MDVVGDLLGRERRSDDLALWTGTRAGSYSYEACCTNAWKAGNLLHHYGVRADATVAVDTGESPTSLTPPPLLALLGAALVGARVRFDPSPATVAADAEGGTAGAVRALVAPVARLDRYDPGPRTQVLAYGDVPDAPGVAHFEAETWSQNPTVPPESVEPEAVAVVAEREYTHECLLTAAGGVVAEYEIGADSEVVLRAPLSTPGAVVAGVLAPLSVGGTVVLDGERAGTHVVADLEATDEPTAGSDAVVIDASAVL